MSSSGITVPLYAVPHWIAYVVLLDDEQYGFEECLSAESRHASSYVAGQAGSGEAEGVLLELLTLVTA